MQYVQCSMFIGRFINVRTYYLKHANSQNRYRPLLAYTEIIFTEISKKKELSSSLYLS